MGAGLELHPLIHIFNPEGRILHLGTRKNGREGVISMLYEVPLEWWESLHYNAINLNFDERLCRLVMGSGKALESVDILKYEMCDDLIVCSWL